MKKNKIIRTPSFYESGICIIALALWLSITILFIGFRPEHIGLAILISALFFVTTPSRRLVVALLPFIIFGISYDWMNLLPNYEVNPIDVKGLYDAEKEFFGIATAQGVLTPNEYFALHTSPLMDFLGGLFYLCWVPLPVIYGLWLYWKKKRRGYLHFAIVFLLVNLIGFGLYYVHPAAPPWYPAKYGFDPVTGTPGNMAGLAAFDAMTGLNIFHGLYERNANVFAAFPSLHSAYTLVAFIYALRLRSGLFWQILLGIVTLGIWTTAVYTSHHYIIDVMGGIGCALAGFILFEYGFMKIPAFKRFMDRYVNYIKAN
ncbi:MAG: phosphatase PAP2 family protein [Prevotella sp.]|nr:phosphatase PAP2 family protein [Bacteroides sp.]MCM1366000.1 phosphatase PAP2 family protein [Prevotella sp.]MCM1436930.1 phosphatase PAP2 family protein [Prevotella sp.]